MKYQRPTFTVPMPGPDVDWPFEAGETTSRARRAEAQGLQCGECGKSVLPGTPHIDQRDEQAGRPRKRVCFGKVLT